jgi:aerobic C4-dicarboxylate transport protein
MIIDTDAAPAVRPPFWRSLYAQVLLAIVLGVLLGWLAPDVGEALKPLGDGFIKLVKMIIAPVIFLTIVTGIAGMRDLGDRSAASRERRSRISCSSPRWRCSSA